MRITRLELFGFKSFPDRTTFEFGPGVSCVVGPNGSGKSNVVDAMRWCIGEQSARTLRGAEMLDVIFAGSAERTPVGFAEVRMTFSSDTGEPFPGAYARLAELQIARRLHRDGTSEYAINGVKCRRRDVLDVFLDTGIGSDLYSFIAQGQVERIVHASPMDRRAIFDEVAGISRYTARRAEAQQRLEATAAQLDRAADVADEMSRRLDALKRQVVKAAEFRRLRALVRQEEIALSLVRYRELAADRKVLHERLRASELESASAKRELARRQQDLTQRREEIAVVDAAAAQWRDEVAELDARAREFEGTRAHQEQRARELRGQAVRQRDVAAGLDAEVARDREREARGVALVRQLEAELEALVAAHQGQAADVAAARAATEAAQLAWSEADHAARAAAIGAATAAQRRDSADREIAALDARVTAASRAAEAATGRLGPLGARLADVGAQIEAVAARAEAARSERAALDDAARVAAERATLLDQDRDRAEQALEAARSALDALVEQAADRAEAARRDAERALVAAEAESEAERRTAREAAERAATELAEAAARRGAALRGLRGDRQRIEAEIAGTEGGIARARAERAALQGSAPAGLGDPAPLADRWALDAASLVAWVDRVGDRVLLPAVSGADEVVAIAAALAPGAEARFVLARDPRPLWEGTWTRCADLRSAVEHHLRTGGACFADGVRIDADGVAVLGRSESIADRVGRRAKLDEQLRSLEASLEGSHRALRETDAAIADLVGEPIPGGHPVQWAAERLADQDRALADRARVEARQRAAAVEGRAERRLSGARAAVAEAVAAVAATRDRVRAEGIAALEQARTSLAAATVAAREGRLAATGAREAALAGATRATEHQTAAARLEGARSVAANELATAEREVATAEANRVALAATLGDARAARDDAQAAVEAAEGRVTETAADLALQLGRLEACRQQEGELQRRDGDARARRAGLEERLGGERSAVAEAAQRAADGERRAEGERRAATETDALAAGAEEAAAAAAQAAGVSAEERGRAWDRLNRERGRATKLREGLAEAEQEGREIQARTEARGARVGELDAEVNRVRVELEVLRRSMEERYQVGLAGLLDRLTVGPIRLDVAPEAREGIEIAGHRVDGVDDLEITSRLFDDAAAIAGLVERNRANREAIAKLGEVHLGALDEYADLTSRHGALLAQREDLEASVTDIRHAIARMNKTCRQRFRDAYDRVNEAFQEVYPRLVGGGTARLSLTDEDDLLQSGVEIFVQPPGKRLQNLSLLSGGEKAMTAIALVIAILKVRPSPFCVLDEVDAPLDEANGARFNDILREMSAVSQFVVITHNRKTMECADTLYGVTMGRPGVSTLVSVNLAG